jgi:4-hydroxybenzoyl-CoA thioesterase/acyl-CoA thioester hydrolase
LGFSVYSEIEGDVVSFPRVAASCEFHSPARCEDVLDIDVTVHRVGTKSVTYAFQFWQQGRDVATGQMTSVCCRVPHGEAPVSIPIPSAVAEKLRALVDN